MRTLLIDDFRDLPSDRTERNYKDGIEALKAEQWDILYLDHDLGACKDCVSKGLSVGDMLTPETTFYNTCSHEKTGYDILTWLEGNKQFLPQKIILVTANPVGRKRMELVIEKLYAERRGR